MNLAEKLGLVAMSRGDERRIKEWLDYHLAAGFNRIHVVLDNPSDESELVLREFSGELVSYEIRPARGVYIDSESQISLAEWRTANSIQIANNPRLVHPMVERQLDYIPQAMDLLGAEGMDWIGAWDVDEFLALESQDSLAQIIMKTKQPRLRFLSSNVDMSGWREGHRVTSHTQIQDRLEIAKVSTAWARRCKSMVRREAVRPFVSVHEVSMGGFEVVPFESAGILHFRVPMQGHLPNYPRFDDRPRRLLTKEPRGIR